MGFAEDMADKMGGAADDDADAPTADDTSAALKSAAKALIDAIHSKDPDAVAAALSACMPLCKGDDDDADGPPGGHAALLLMPHPKG